ncbi:hypothetical protein PPERSA_02841 [Pseudocohnilembus persalinus]|uniref:Terpenoid synthase n=1 Tax=Pseudocohnilembus persalinus TaxID=266149 RepID=A0A0V0QMK8_PSEPJ|nr:hypothetical protein PPERSA_02841 [Pseudocohnilembus persalinus]|eukprot:KRX03462.1 hypothetical protein PPERSA_02841 [Pseudocohnilembus persalinus]
MLKINNLLQAQKQLTKFLNLNGNKSINQLNIYLKPQYTPELKIEDEKYAKMIFQSQKQSYFNLSPKEIKGYINLIEKYSRSYYTKIPLLGKILHNKRALYENEELYKDMQKLMNKIVTQMPKKSFKLQMLFENFEYPRKLCFPKLIIEFSKVVAESQKEKIDPVLAQKIWDLGYAMENINIGFFLHNTLDNLNELQELATSQLHKRMIQKLSDKKLVLIGDYYHVKASLESSKLGLIEIPMYMSTIEEETSKAICKRLQLKEKIAQFQKQNEKMTSKDLSQLVEIKDIYDLAYYQTANITAYSFMATSLMIFDSVDQKILDESFKIGFDLGLALHFQRSVQRYMAIWPASIGQLVLKPQDLYSTGFNLPNYAMVQCYKHNTNIQEVHNDVLKFCEMHIENLKDKAKNRVESLGGDFNRLEKLMNSFLNQV